MTTKTAEIRDPVVRAALLRLDGRLRERFSVSYRGLILFGSRARGDHEPDSDADVAVVMRGTIENRWRLKCEIIDQTYPILLDTGLYIQPQPVEEREIDNPDGAANPALLRNIIKEGVPA